MHPCRGAVRGDTKPVVSLTLDHRLQAGMPPASHSDALIRFFCFCRMLLCRRIRSACHKSSVSPLRNRTTPLSRSHAHSDPSSSGRGTTLQKTAFPRSCLIFTHTTHRKQRRTPMSDSPGSAARATPPQPWPKSKPCCQRLKGSSPHDPPQPHPMDLAPIDSHAVGPRRACMTPPSFRG